ncbi:MAG: sugar transferase [Bacillaceae bacterium]|nr:sugar transferase [Bacillaceae bacterium]
MSDLVKERSHKMILVFIDLGIILLSYILAFSIRFPELPEQNWESFRSLIPWILLISAFFIFVYELHILNRKSKWDIVRNVLVASIFIMLLTMSASFLFREFALPRSIIGISFIFYTLMLIFWKTLFVKLSQEKKPGVVLFIGSTFESQKVIEQIKFPFGKGKKIIDIQPNTSLDRIIDFINQVDYVLIGSSVSGDLKSDIIYHAIKKQKLVYVLPELYDLLLSKAVITSLDDSMVMAVKPFGLSWDQQLVKRVYDIIFSAISLTILLPLFLLISIAIKLEDSKGGVFYKQKRIGKNNKEFTILKFRSMIEGAENLTGPKLAEEDDPRITKVGQFIRKTRLDEIPQFINVLKGDMSIVGPRPEREYFVKQFSQDHRSYRYRNAVKPGITGYAQIMGKYTTDVEDKLRYDLYYIRNYSFLFDIIIQLRTFIVLLDKAKSEGKKTKISEEKKEQLSG